MPRGVPKNKTATVRKRDTTFDKKHSGMGFNAGVVRFYSRFSAYSCHPLGGSRKDIVEGQVVRINTPHIQFQNNCYGTEDATEAKMLIEFSNFGDDRWGYVLDTTCLPKQVAQVWSSLSDENRKRVCLALVDGREAKGALACVDENDLRSAQQHQRDIVEEHQQVCCPVPGCDAPPLTGKSAAAELMLHMKAIHPEWKQESLDQTMAVTG